MVGCVTDSNYVFMGDTLFFFIPNDGEFDDLI